VDDEIELARAFFRGLGDRSRLAILEHLRGGPSRVSDIVDATGLAQANVSSHLACLWECGLLARQRQGREVHYKLISGVDDLLEAAGSILLAAGRTLGACPSFGVQRSLSETHATAPTNCE
jgi:ArsR family transcriptional regulator, cadmium/lead-responsive transcriptional repressor